MLDILVEWQNVEFSFFYGKNQLDLYEGLGCGTLVEVKSA